MQTIEMAQKMKHPLGVGLVVRSLRGHDKGLFYLVVRVDGDRVMVADGKYRTLENPKAKNAAHLAPTAKVFEVPKTDKKLRELLFRYNNPEEYDRLNHKGNT